MEILHHRECWKCRAMTLYSAFAEIVEPEYQDDTSHALEVLVTTLEKAAFQGTMSPILTDATVRLWRAFKELQVEVNEIAEEGDS